MLKNKIIVYLGRNNLIPIKDKKYLEALYELKMKKKLDLQNPSTFNEKLQWLKIYDRNPKYIKLVDKYEVKQIVSDIIGEEYVVPTLGVYNNFDEIDFDTLPECFVMKCTHDSGSTILCRDKKNFDQRKAKKNLNKYLKRNFFYCGREWPYKNVHPRIIIESLLKDEKQKDILDYKFLCFNGKVRLCFVCSDRYSSGGLKVDFYDLNWKHMPFERHYKNSDRKIKKPKKFQEMIRLAERLAENIPFVRIDFFEVNGQIYFGEYTFYPGCGLEEFTPEKWDGILGEWINLSDGDKNENTNSR